MVAEGYVSYLGVREDLTKASGPPGTLRFVVDRRRSAPATAVPLQSRVEVNGRSNFAQLRYDPKHQVPAEDIPTTGWLSGVPPAEPWKVASP